MTEEEKKAKAIADAKALLGVTDDVLEKAKKADELKASLEGVVSELQETRKKKGEAEDELKTLKGVKAPDDVDTKVRAILNEENDKKSVSNKTAAEQKFKSTHKEFHPDNDPGGIKFSALQEKLKRINASGAISEEDHLNVFEDALDLLKKDATRKATPYAPYAASPASTHSPKEGDKDELSPKEEKLVKNLGWDKDRYLKQKASKPDYIRTLLKGIEE